MKLPSLIVTVFMVVFSNGPVFAQTPGDGAPKVIYWYDDAGNRIKRRIIQLSDPRLADTTATEEQVEPPLQDGDILAYPNPTRGEVTIGISPNLLEDATANYILVDLSGREVRKGPIVQSQTGLDLTGEANGNYILSVFVGERKEEWQIVKQ